MASFSKGLKGFCTLLIFQAVLNFSYMCTSMDFLSKGNAPEDLIQPPENPSTEADQKLRDHPQKVLDPKIAAVVTTAYVDECTAVRLRHLVETSGMDVWLMEGHQKVENKSLVEASKRLISDISDLKSWPQSNNTLSNFDSMASGPSKSSFLKFLVDHEEYEFAWHIESDVFFTGFWSEALVLGEELKTTDFVYPKAHQKDVSNPWWDIVRQRKGNIGCFVGKKPCQGIGPYQFYWMTSRVSRRLATSLFEDLKEGSASGHHEALMAAYCNSKGFSTQGIPGRLLGGTFHAGSMGSSDKREAEERGSTLARRGRPRPSKLYHPVKCAAYSSAYVMQAEIDQWLRPTGSTPSTYDW